MMPHSHVAGALLEACRALEPLVRAGPGDAEVQAVAEGLRRLAPGAPLYACLLQGDGPAWIGLCDEVGSAEPRAAKTLREMLKRAALSDAACLPLARTDKLPGQALALQPLEIAGRRLGVLAILLAKATDDVPALRHLLGAFAQHVSVAVAWRHECAQRGILEQQLTEETRRGDIGEMVGPALHEVGNFINSVFLTLAVLERKVPPELRGDFTGLRKQGHAVAALAGHIQQTRRATAGAAIDLHAALREALAWLQAGAGGAADSVADSVADGVAAEGVAAEGVAMHVFEPGTIEPVRWTQGVSIELVLAPTELQVGGRSDVKRLCRFLVKNAAAATGAGGKITIATEGVRAGAVLRIADSGPPLGDGQLHHVWDANDALARPGTNALELATCWSLCKRLGGKLDAENSADGGVAVTLRLPLANQ